MRPQLLAVITRDKPPLPSLPFPPKHHASRATRLFQISSAPPPSPTRFSANSGSTASPLASPTKLTSSPSPGASFCNPSSLARASQRRQRPQLTAPPPADNSGKPHRPN